MLLIIILILITSLIFFSRFANKIPFNKNVTCSVEELSDYKYDSTPEQGLYSNTPYFGKYLEKFLQEKNNNEEDDEEYKLSNNSVSSLYY